MPPPFCRVDFATLGTRPDPINARVIRAGFSHEIIVLRFRDRDLSSKNYRSDIPIEVQWGVYPRYRERFVGYVHHVTTDVRRDVGEHHLPIVELLAVGTTRVIRDEQPRNWGQTQADRVVREFTRRYNLDIDVDPSPVHHNQLMQPAQSGWEFLVKIAKEDGLFLSVSGTRVHLWNLDRRMKELKAYAPIFDYRKNEVSRFLPVSGETNPSVDQEATRRSAYTLTLGGYPSAFSDGFTPPTNSLTGFLDPDPRFTQVESGVVLDSPREAKTHLEAKRRSTERIYRAQADLAAFPRLRDGDMVVFENYGDRQSGMWFVDRVEFNLNKREITSKIEVSRSIMQDSLERPRYPGGKSKYRRPWRASLVNGAWVDRSGL